MELLAQPNIKFLGRVSPEEAQQTIAKAALLLSTSDEEGFPNTFLQAWASGTPVLGLGVDPDQVVSRERLGAVSNDLDGAIAEIKKFLSSPVRR